MWRIIRRDLSENLTIVANFQAGNLLKYFLNFRAGNLLKYVLNFRAGNLLQYFLNFSGRQPAPLY